MVYGKGNRQERLPLPVDVGEASAAWLHGRPDCQKRRATPTSSSADIVVEKARRTREAQKVAITAEIANVEGADAGPTTTRLILDGGTELKVVETAAIPAGGAATVSLVKGSRDLEGDHTIQSTAEARKRSSRRTSRTTPLRRPSASEATAS